MDEVAERMGAMEQGSGREPVALEIVVFAAADEPTVIALPRAGKLSIGRAEGCDVRIDDASVSRKHAVLHVGPTLRVEDTGSSNGTYLKRHDERASAGETRRVLRSPGETFIVSPGDCIVFGSVLALVRRAHSAFVAAGGEALATGGVVVEDPSMKALYEDARRYAGSTISVLLLGETGVGKEVLARAIHETSGRAKGPFVALHCASLSESLLESELFGHKKGSFTGATEDKKGLFEAADGGTLFLDEIGELSRDMQVKLLRVLEERAVLRIGERTPRKVDVRFVSATNRDLEAEIQKENFRSDLYYRLAGVELLIPPLRERALEILPLAAFFLAEACRKNERAMVPTISPKAALLLQAYEWRGNVRELRNAMERAAVIAAEIVLPEHLPERLRSGGKPASASNRAQSSASSTTLLTVAPKESVPLEEKKDLERKRIVEALDVCAGNQTRAAQLLGISRRTLVSRLEEYDLPRPRK